MTSLSPNPRKGKAEREAAGEIAAGLRPTLVRAIKELTMKPQYLPITFSVRAGYALERMGLAKRTLLSDRTYLTPLGLEVRTILERSPHA